MTTPQKPNPPGQGRTLGQTPQTTRTPIKTAPKAAEPVVDEIDWDKVDTDDLETQAILSTPGSSQQASQTPGQTPKTGSTSFQDRLRAAVDDGVNKRNRDDEEQTPKRARIDPDEVSHMNIPPGKPVLTTRTHSSAHPPHLDHRHTQSCRPLSHPLNRSLNISNDKRDCFEQIPT